MDQSPPFVQVINLVRQRDRRDAIQQRMAELGIDCKILKAVDYKDLSEAEIAAQGPEFSLRMLRPLSKGEVACSMSHRQALYNIAESQYEYGIILEDDAVLPDDFLTWISDPTLFPEDWDMVKLSGHYIQDRQVWTFGSIRDRRLIYTPKCTIGTACYLVTREAAGKLAKNLELIDEPVDRFFANQYRNHVVCYEVVPFPVTVAPVESTISDREGAQFRKTLKQTLQKKLWRLQQSIGVRLQVLRKVGLIAAITLTGH
ncbi:glycosyltransferase family 25 protein [uncultured Cohaesibacter sp.]|uniref:glycosyltransferase family 25 protein n=1 Tax=uncultured Cohaesibacter sp. TaxID=1002546 RepID=UPI0029C848B7|nr:glycosyltransferase family 25 protein [uncultured Cohaesibacter sp.]